MNSFSDLNIDSGLKTQLSKLEFNQPTPIQAKVIPLVIEGNDVLATAPTGTGKTLAFGLPMMTQLINRNIHSALILTPTRELAIQILKEFKKKALEEIDDPKFKDMIGEVTETFVGIAL